MCCILLLIEKSHIFQSESTLCPINSVYEGLCAVKEKIAELEKLHRSLRDKRQADRVKAVIALSMGLSAAQVAEILLFDEKTSRHYFDRYQQGGLTALLDDSYSGAEPKLDTHQMSEIKGYLEEHILPDAKSVIAHIDRQYGVHYSVSGVTNL